jgi:hypothetical protein
MGAPTQNALDAAGSGFDTATLVVDGHESRWSAEQFRKMPLLDRIRVLAGGRVVFFRNGAEVPAREALRGL